MKARAMDVVSGNAKAPPERLDRSDSPLSATLGRLGVEADDLAALLDEHLQHRGTTQSAATSATLSTGDREFLDAHSGIKPLDELALHRAAGQQVTDLAAEMTALLNDSLRGAEVADALRVQPASVRDRKRHGSLYALSGGSENRYPRWQLVHAGDGRTTVLPHLREVLGALPPDLHPLEVDDFFTLERGWLRLRGRAVSVSTWLASGGAVDEVLTAAADARLTG